MAEFKRVVKLMETLEDNIMEFTLGGWVANSIAFNGLKKSHNIHLQWRATFFENKESRDIFLELSKEQYADQEFFAGTLEGVPIIQTRQRK